MEKVKIILENGIEKEVSSIFYLYNSKYYFIYTEKEIDENNYVVFNIVEVGKEIINTENGPLDTGYMVGIEVNDNKEMQNAITKIVNDQKNGTQDPEIIYLPITMLSTLKIINKKTFRLLKNVVEENFKINLFEDALSDSLSMDNIESSNENLNLVGQQALNSSIDVGDNELQGNYSDVYPYINEGNSSLVESLFDQEKNKLQDDQTEFSNQTFDYPNSISSSDDSIEQNDVIIDYRARFFEEQEKNKTLQAKIDELIKKIEDIKKIIEY